MPCRRMIETGMPCVSSKIAENRSVASTVWRPDRLACSSASLKSSLVDGATRRSRPRDARQQAQVLLERLQDLVRVELQVTHDLPEHVPFDLGERQADVLVGQQRRVRGGGPRPGRDRRHAQLTQPACSAGCRSLPRPSPSAARSVRLDVSNSRSPLPDGASQSRWHSNQR